MKKPICCIALATLFLAAGPTSRPALTPRNDLAGLKNFAQVSDDLYRAAQPTAEGFAELKKLGIKTVINLRSFHSDKDELKGTGLNYLHIYAKAWHMEDEDVIKFLKVVSDPANRPVFVHCQHGADRTGCMVAIYRMVEQGWTLDEAAAELPKFGFHPVWKQIKSYLKKFDPAVMKKKVAEAEAPKIKTVP